MTRSRSFLASGSFIPLIVRQISTDAFGDMRNCRPEHFTVRSGSSPVIEYPRSGMFLFAKVRIASKLALKRFLGLMIEDVAILDCSLLWLSVVLVTCDYRD